MDSPQHKRRKLARPPVVASLQFSSTPPAADSMPSPTLGSTPKVAYTPSTPTLGNQSLPSMSSTPTGSFFNVRVDPESNVLVALDDTPVTTLTTPAPSVTSGKTHAKLVYLLISQIWVRYWLSAIRQQAITWFNVDWTWLTCMRSARKTFSVTSPNVEFDPSSLHNHV